MKHRIFDPKEKKMYYSKDNPKLCITMDGQVASWDENQGWDTTYTKHMIPLVSIELTDKNGKEIYEGDIVKFKLYSWTIGVVKFGKGTYDSGVYKMQGFYIDNLKDLKHPNWEEEADGCPGYLFECEVIGNIYENPELIKTD